MYLLEVARLLLASQADNLKTHHVFHEPYKCLRLSIPLVLFHLRVGSKALRRYTFYFILLFRNSLLGLESVRSVALSLRWYNQSDQYSFSNKRVSKVGAVSPFSI